MATFKGIKGVKVQSTASDPTASEATGTVWYNTASTALKYATEADGTWATGGALNTPRYGAVGAGAGVPSSILFAGAIPAKGDTETYDGTNWTEVANLNTARYSSAGCGTETAALSFSGTPGGGGGVGTKTTEEWGGTSWVAQNDLNTARNGAHGAGIQTAALCIGGHEPAKSVKVEDYDGTCWTEVASLLTATDAGIAAAQGTPSATLFFTGRTAATPAGGKLCESFDGTSWTEVNNTNTGRNTGGGSGIQTLALCFGGDSPDTSPGSTVNTEKWDGTCWTETANLAIGGYEVSGAGTQGSAICAAGAPTPTRAGVSEEWVDPVYSIKTVTVS
jgi:hypothetical protein